MLDSPNIYVRNREEGRKEMILINDILNTFYLPLYGIRHRLKDHSDGVRGNPSLRQHRTYHETYLLPMNDKGQLRSKVGTISGVHLLQSFMFGWKEGHDIWSPFTTMTHVRVDGKT